MRILVWLFRALIFFTLFAFALNNQQQANVRWFFGVEWHAPMVIVVLAAFAARLRLRRAGDGAELVAAPPRGAAPVARHRRRASDQRSSRTDSTTSEFAARAPAARRPLTRAMDFDLQWLLIGLPVAFALGWVASRFDLRQVQARRPRRAEGLLQGPEPAAQRAARQGHRRLHRGGAARPRHHRAALRPGQPVPPPRRLRARGARAPAPAGTRRPEGRGAQPRAARAGRGLHEGRPVRPRRGGLQGARRHGLRRRGAPGAAVAARARARLACRHRGGDANWNAAAAAPSPRASRTTRARWRSRPMRAGQPQQADRSCSAHAQAAPQAVRPMLLAGQRLARARRPCRRHCSSGTQLLAQHPAAWPLVAQDYARSAVGLRRLRRRPRAACSQAYEAEPDIDLLQARLELEGVASAARTSWCSTTCSAKPTLGAAAKVLELPRGDLGRRARRRSCARWSPPRPSRCSATAAPPAASRHTTTSGNARAARAGTPIRRGAWRRCERRRRRAHRAVHEVGHQVRPAST